MIILLFVGLILLLSEPLESILDTKEWVAVFIILKVIGIICIYSSIKIYYKIYRGIDW